MPSSMFCASCSRHGGMRLEQDLAVDDVAAPLDEVAVVSLSLPFFLRLGTFLTSVVILVLGGDVGLLSSPPSSTIRLTGTVSPSSM